MPIFSKIIEGKKHQILFVHIPKSGGTTINEFFKFINYKSYFEPNKFFKKQLKIPPQHYNYKILDSLLNLNKFSFSFTVVRNPFDKLISSYLWSLKYSSVFNKKFYSFEEWFDITLSNFKRNENFMANHIIQQVKFVGPKINSIYKFEVGIDKIILDILKKNNIEIKNLQIPILNKSDGNRNEIKRNLLNQPLIINEIIELYHEDFKTFNYDTNLNI